LKLGALTFSEKVAQTLSTFMFVITGALILPAAFDFALPDTGRNDLGGLSFSRGTSIVLLILYLQFLVYQLKTHSHHFDRPGKVINVNDQGGAGPVISRGSIGFTILLVAVAISICSDFLVNSVDNVVLSFGISKSFVGLIIVPLIGNAGIQ
jgi:Ca2+:H+ antiporter